MGDRVLNIKYRILLLLLLSHYSLHITSPDTFICSVSGGLSGGLSATNPTSCQSLLENHAVNDLKLPKGLVVQLESAHYHDYEHYSVHEWLGQSYVTYYVSVVLDLVYFLRYQVTWTPVVMGLALAYVTWSFIYCEQ